MDLDWLLLIYSVPAEPSRKRAFIWREIKAVGAAPLRDGAYVLPDRPTTRVAADAIATRIRVYGGLATLAHRARLEATRSMEVVAQFRAASDGEYTEIRNAAEGLLEHLARESEHRNVTYADLQILAHDLAKLRRWRDQVRARDYFEAPVAGFAENALARCADALGGMPRATRRHAAVAP